MGTKKWVLLTAIIALVSLGYYLLMPPPATPDAVPVAQLAVPAPVVVEALPPGEPLERYPIDSATVAIEKESPLALDASDGVIGKGLAQLLGKKTLAAYLYPDKRIRRFVATIDNLPRQEAPARMMPVKPVGGAFLVKRSDAGMTIDPANAKRYLGYLKVMAAVDARRLVDLYIGFYPLFQQAYRELGYPKGYFNDRLIEALDDLLAAPDVVPPVALQQPKVLYQFADPVLEGRSAGQKIMVRMGGDNMAQAKTLLGTIRRELLSRSPAK
jgi:hypothetical protein